MWHGTASDGKQMNAGLQSKLHTIEPASESSRGLS